MVKTFITFQSVDAVKEGDSILGLSLSMTPTMAASAATCEHNPQSSTAVEIEHQKKKTFGDGKPFDFHNHFAKRFRTQLCKTFAAKRRCPYDARCMFAHGEKQLRTTEMNLRDGLTSEAAIREFKVATMKTRKWCQEELSNASKWQQQDVPLATAAGTTTLVQRRVINKTKNEKNKKQSGLSLEPIQLSAEPRFVPPPPPPLTTSEGCQQQMYRRDPYSWNALDF